MIRITALNAEADDESSSDREEVTREALEEIAFQQYAKTLELQKRGNLRDALKLLKDLLDTELLDDVEKDSPLLSLKYSCYKNVAALSFKLDDHDGAVEAYLRASELDDGDVTLWYRLGKICLDRCDFRLARYAFRRGVDCNPKHWPCVDNLITLLLGLGDYNECIANVYCALEMDADYFRGRTYRKHIFTDYPYVQEYMALVDPVYKWRAEDDDGIGGEEYDKLLREAAVINDNYIKRIDENKTSESLPALKLNRPVKTLTWSSLGESLSDMHGHMSKKRLSHACFVEICLPVNAITPPDEPMEVETEIETPPEQPTEETAVPVTPKVVDVEKTEETKNGSSETDKENADQENATSQDVSKSSSAENKEGKKSVTRRRGSSLSFLEQWEWCTKRRSSRKKPLNRNDRSDETIHETLKRLLPQIFLSDDLKLKKTVSGDDSLDTMDIYKLFEEKEKKGSESSESDEQNSRECLYFGTDKEESDVENFILKYVDSKCDIITLVDEYILVLSKRWKSKWPDDLGPFYVKCNLCSKQHMDPPLGCDNSEGKINEFVLINLIHLEIEVNKLIRNTDIKNEIIDIELMDALRLLCLKYEGTAEDMLDVLLRYLWVKCHAFLYQDETEFALDCLYQMLNELNCLDDMGESYSLTVPNFSAKPTINKSIIVKLLKSLERSKQLSTISQLYELEKYEEILPILQESFKYCQSLANKQEWTDMGLDWAVYLVILLETLWALEDIEQCFTWAVISLHEATKQFVLCIPNEPEYEKWILTIVKILITIEHILKKEGSSYLEILPEKGLVHLVQDLVQIIVHQLDDGNCFDDIPIKSVVPWVLLHYILQREEDCGRLPKKDNEEDANDKDDIPPSIMILFTGHNFLGKRGWCTVNDGSLLYFILTTIMPRFKSPALTVAAEPIRQCLEQVVFCIFGHPSKKTKNRYLSDHNTSPHKLDWNWTQQIFELYKPFEMPEFNSYRLASISNETEQLFQRMLSLLPSTLDPQPLASEVVSYIENKRENLPEVGFVFPHRVRDIYYLLADYYLKNNETIRALKYYAIDIVINQHRFDSWAGNALARASLLETKLNSCKTFKTEMEYLNRAAAVERCFKKALDIDPSHSILWIEYGAFVYGVHSFCSRMLKQASESLSMENFETLEKRKDDMLSTAHKCFILAHKEWLNEYESEDTTLQDERWLHFYMLGKIAEKKGDSPKVYLDHYIKAGQYLLDNNATYPLKINYNNPQNLSVEALEIHYRIHASILKYIEQHENKAILMSVGKVFKDCLVHCGKGPFSKKKQTKESVADKDTPSDAVVLNDNVESTPDNINTDNNENHVSVLKRSSSMSDSDVNLKKPKLSECNSMNKSIEVDKFALEDINTVPSLFSKDFDRKDLVAGDMMETAGEVVICSERDSNDTFENINDKSIMEANSQPNIDEQNSNIANSHYDTSKNTSIIGSNKVNVIVTLERNKNDKDSQLKENGSKSVITETRRTSQESTTTNTATSKDDSSSESSSDSSSDESTSSSSSDSSNVSAAEKTIEKKDDMEMSQDDINEIIAICLDNLEDCVSRFPQHYKALYRLTHYHFYYKKDKSIDRCKDLMLGSFLSRGNAKIQGLFCERKNSNFFNGIWRIPASEIDRPGSFASHMSRCVLITMEILKEVDDYKTLFDLSIQLQRTPEADKKYLRDAERGELAQQALSLCTRSIKGIFTKVSTGSIPNTLTQVQDFMLDLYKVHQKAQKLMPSKSQMFSSPLIDCYKFLVPTSGIESNLLELSIKYSQSLNSIKKHSAMAPTSSSTITTTLSNTIPNVTVTVTQTKKVTKTIEPTVPKTVPSAVSGSTLPTMDLKQSFAKNLCTQSVTNPLMNYIPPTMNPLLTALSYHVSNMEKLGYNTSNTDFLKLMSSTLLAAQNQSIVKCKPVETVKKNPPLKRSVSASSANISKSRQSSSASSISLKNLDYLSSYYSGVTKSMSEITKNVTLPNLSNPLLHTSSNTYTSMTNNSLQIKPNHVSVVQVPATVKLSTSKPPMPHQQTSPSKTLQEKLAEKQKQSPNLTKNPNAQFNIDVISPRSVACAAFSGKIPASLTITKSTMGKILTPEDPLKLPDDNIINTPTKKSNNESRKISTFDQSTDKPGKSKNVVDTSEIIVLDDDDD